MSELLRVARLAIVTFPNFGYWRARLDVLLGNMPVSKNLPFQWYDTPNVHLCTIDDFEAYCESRKIAIRERVVLNNGASVGALPNLRGELAVYQLARA